MCSITHLGLAKEYRKSSFCHLIFSNSTGTGDWMEEGRGRGTQNQPPRSLSGLPLVPWAPAVWAFFLSLSEQNSFPAEGLRIGCFLSLEDISLPLHPTIPTHPQPEMPLPQGCLPSSHLGKLSYPAYSSVCSPYHNGNLNIYCVIKNTFSSIAHMYYWHWHHILPCSPWYSPNASYSDWHMADI